MVETQRAPDASLRESILRMNQSPTPALPEEKQQVKVEEEDPNTYTEVDMEKHILDSFEKDKLKWFDELQKAKADAAVAEEEAEKAKEQARIAEEGAARFQELVQKRKREQELEA